MKAKKGNPNYITKRKSYVLIKTLAEFGIAAALLILGILETGSRLNMLTLVAVLGCLPASKALVELIMLLPHKSISEIQVKEICAHTESLTMAYDMVITSSKKIMPIESVAISGNTICGFASSPKVDIAYTEQYLKQMLNENQFMKVSVKLFKNYDAYLTRIKEMNHHAKGEERRKNHEEKIRHVLLNISL